MCSPYLKVAWAPDSPAFQTLSVDSLGNGNLDGNPVIPPSTPTRGWNLVADNSADCHRYTLDGSPAWEMSASEKQISLRSFPVPDNAALVLLINQKANHATLLGRMGDTPNRMQLPAVLHFPDCGSFRITASRPDAHLIYDAARHTPEGDWVRVEFPPAQDDTIEYRMEVVAIYPQLPGVEQACYDGFRRNFLNIFQINPRIGILANNSSSDSCGFCLYEHALMAEGAPPLADGLSCMDLVRLSLSRVFAGQLTYGQVGYTHWRSPYEALDVAPSLLIAGALAGLDAGGGDWGSANFDTLANIGKTMMARDRNNNGLIEYEMSGNSGSWSGRAEIRPSNWWDAIGFAHEDAYANALAFLGCLKMSELAGKLERSEERTWFSAQADRIRTAYYPAFFNPASGILAGWRSADEKIHDYGFTFVNGLAVAVGLVSPEQGNAIMDRLLALAQRVGYTNFRLGLPGNLLPIRREDYAHLEKRWGGPELEDGTDAFQIYENGGATACHAYWLVKALYTLGRKEDARAIFYPLLEGYAAGDFQGRGDNGKSKDWKNWKGECSGYEGFLLDGYLAPLAVRDDLSIS